MALSRSLGSRRIPVLAAGLSLLFCAAALPANSPDVVDAVRIDPSTGLLQDARGRTRIFHGVNVVYKQAPWYPPSDKFTPDDSLDARTMDLLRKWGFNVVRLGVMWPGVEPTPGRIDHAYLAEVDRLAAELAKRGVYTLVDLHQDIGSRRFCGEGFPEHYVDALEKDPASKFSQAAQWPGPLPWSMPMNGSVPSLEQCLKHQFATYYATEKVGAMWGSLYTPGSSLNQGFVRYWQAVAKRLAGKSHVVGYELLNEPSGFCLGADAASCLELPIGDGTEAKKLTPLYQAAAEAIRAIDPDTPIWYEPAVLPKMTSVFPNKPLGNDTQQGLAYHIYCAPGDGSGPIGAAICYAAQDLFADLYYGFLHQHKGIGGFMTEFGAIGDSPKELKHLERLLNFADGELQSWTYWQLKKYADFTTANAAESLYDEHGELEETKLRTLSRTYAPAIGGAPSKMAFDAGTGAFTLAFTATVRDAPTVVYLNEELNYPGGYSLEVTPAHCLSQHKEEPNYINLYLVKGASCEGSSVTVTVRRKGVAGEGEGVLVI